MYKPVWYVGFFLTNLFKLKFKAIHKYLTCERFRSDISKLINLLSQGYPKIYEHGVPLYKLYLSHTIVYPEWVRKLRTKPYSKVIHVVREGDHYLVVDGNHRLKALMDTSNPQTYTWVKEIYFSDSPEVDYLDAI